MSAYVAKDSKGSYHYILVQEYAMSCGPACVAMAEASYHQHCMEDAESRARFLSQLYPGNWTMEGGSYVTNFSFVLNSEGVKADPAVYVPGGVRTYVQNFASPSTPMIVHVRWGGDIGHFIVASKVYPDNTVIFYDPSYGLVEMPGAQFPYYTPRLGVAGLFSGWVVVTHH
ncbi:MAG: cysteine peptidase family C39 domain-containing protein [Bryobacteraceae bacterium]|jgi:ABC-type bacteriocin/lantibiotic exporter with double-glycine peptidase domain